MTDIRHASYENGSPPSVCLQPDVKSLCLCVKLVLWLLVNSCNATDRGAEQHKMTRCPGQPVKRWHLRGKDDGWSPEF